MKAKVRMIAGILAILIGAGIFLYPDVSTWIQKGQSRKAIELFNEQFDDNKGNQSGDIDQNGDSEGEQTGENGQSSDNEVEQEQSGFAAMELLAKIQAYNRDLYENGQSEFRDAWSVTQSPDTIPELEDQMFGYIEIPAMELSLPIYIGASTSNMAKGAAVLGATSIPIGGENTNAVIAGHRGYCGAPYFREIEKLAVGDAVYVINPWQTLGYRVESIDIISPTDSDAVKIREGKDMITLVTCHPYRSHGKYRYLVFCSRDESLDGQKTDISETGSVSDQESDAAAAGTRVDESETDDETDMEETAGSGMIESSDGTLYCGSEEDIRNEAMLRKGGALLILLMVLITFIKVRNEPKL